MPLVGRGQRADRAGDQNADQQRAADVAVLARHQGLTVADARIATRREREEAGMDDGVWLRPPAD